jgi:hypothetical protein
VQREREERRARTLLRTPPTSFLADDRTDKKSAISNIGRHIRRLFFGEREIGKTSADE